MKKLVIALVCVSSLSAFADRFDRRHDRREHRHGRPIIIMNTCRADLMSTRGVFVRSFQSYGFNACNEALSDCQRVADNKNYIRFSRVDKFYCQVYR